MKKSTQPKKKKKIPTQQLQHQLQFSPFKLPSEATEEREFNSAPSLNRKSEYCGAISTPMWRVGPDEVGTI